jgi:hypothetical protein
MRFLIVNTDYAAFVDSLYAGRPGLADAPYATQMQARNDSLFGVADFYSANLRALGHEAQEVHANVEPLQRRWAADHGLRLPPEATLRRRTERRLRRLAGVRPPLAGLDRVLAEQVRTIRPDVLLVHDMIKIDPALLRRLKRHAGLLVGQHAAAPLPHRQEALQVYDLVLSSFPPTVERFRRGGIPAELHRLGFEPRVLDHLAPGPRRPVVTFVGSLYPGVHDSRIRLLEQVAARFGDAFELWSPHADRLPADSALHGRNRGTAWGSDMYRVLRESAVTLNEHGSIEPHANNCRLYEATGVGAPLVTDWKPDLAELFEPGREVAAFHDAEECIALVERLLGDEQERERLAQAGQQRTLADHTYRRRMAELVELLEPRFAGRRAV